MANGIEGPNNGQADKVRAAFKAGQHNNTASFLHMPASRSVVSYELAKAEWPATDVVGTLVDSVKSTGATIDRSVIEEGLKFDTVVYKPQPKYDTVNQVVELVNTGPDSTVTALNTSDTRAELQQAATNAAIGYELRKQDDTSRVFPKLDGVKYDRKNTPLVEKEVVPTNFGLSEVVTVNPVPTEANMFNTSLGTESAYNTPVTPETPDAPTSITSAE